MPDYALNPVRWDTAHTFLTSQEESFQPALLWNNPGEKFCKVHSNAINMIMGRVQRETLQMGIRCAFDIAAASRPVRAWEGFLKTGAHHWLTTKAIPDSIFALDYNGQWDYGVAQKEEDPQLVAINDTMGQAKHRVLYINTYQERSRLKEWIVKESDQVKAKWVGYKETVQKEFEALVADGKATPPEPITTVEWESDRVDSPFDWIEDLPLNIIDIKMGEWELMEEKTRDVIKENKIDVVVVNSFEYATMTQRGKEKFTRKLIEWQREYKLSVVICSTDVRKGMTAGVASRGSIGMLTAFAETVNLLDPEPVKKEKRPTNATFVGVHERQMHAPQDEEELEGFGEDDEYPVRRAQSINHYQFTEGDEMHRSQIELEREMEHGLFWSDEVGGVH